jgi:hypothetical protein
MRVGGIIEQKRNTQHQNQKNAVQNEYMPFYKLEHLQTLRRFRGLGLRPSGYDPTSRVQRFWVLGSKVQGSGFRG